MSISLKQVTLCRDQQPVLHNLTLDLTEQRIALVGNNGSGKSSLARLLNGLLQADQGDIEVHRKFPARGVAQMADTVGFIFQNPDHQLIFPTVAEELAFGLRNQGLSSKDSTLNARQFLLDHNRIEWADRPVHSLSEGQKQLVCIFSVLILKPELIILDEPFSALDLPTRMGLMKWLNQLPQQILMISHDFEFIRDFDRVIWLKDGHVHMDGPPKIVIDQYLAQCREEPSIC